MITNLSISASSGYCVCSICTERTVLLVPFILLGKVNLLVDISAQIEVTKGREKPQQLYVYGWPGCVYGRPV